MSTPTACRLLVAVVVALVSQLICPEGTQTGIAPFFAANETYILLEPSSMGVRQNGAFRNPRAISGL